MPTEKKDRASRAKTDPVWDRLNADGGGTLEPILDEICRKWPALTILESHIASLITMDYSNGEIAEVYRTDVRNIDNHTSSIRKTVRIERNKKLREFLKEEIGPARHYCYLPPNADCPYKENDDPDRFSHEKNCNKPHIVSYQ